MLTASRLELTLGFLPQCQKPISLHKPHGRELRDFGAIAQKMEDTSQWINSLAAYPSGGKYWEALCTSLGVDILEKLNPVAYNCDLKNTSFYGLFIPPCLSLSLSAPSHMLAKVISQIICLQWLFSDSASGETKIKTGSKRYRAAL